MSVVMMLSYRGNRLAPKAPVLLFAHRSGTAFPLIPSMGALQDCPLGSDLFPGGWLLSAAVACGVFPIADRVAFAAWKIVPPPPEYEDRPGEEGRRSVKSSDIL
jgi:hypothetical protein